MFYLFKQTITSLESNQSRLEFEQGLSLRSSARYLGLFLYVFGFLGATVSWQSASAETFFTASSRELISICNSNNPIVSACAGGTNSRNSDGAGSQSQPNSILISQQQLKDAQTSKEKEDMVPGGSSDVLTAQWGDKFSTFLTAGATTLRHSSNAFEQGYRATIPSVTLGGGYLISENLETGLAFNYSNSDADYNNGGGFEVDSYTPLFYINYLPFNNAFTSLALSYTRQDQSNNRIAVVDPDGSGATPALTPFSTSGDLNTNQYNLNFLSGYDFSVESFTFGPRVGVDVRHWEMDAYQESSNTGLELRYDRQRQTSIQSTVGLSASFAHSIASGVIIPQFSASWVHEFANDERTINARFIRTSTPNSFSFLTERPVRDWAVIDFGVSFVMQNGIQAFVNFSTVQGNSNFESYGGNLGIRIGL